jgi:aminoglycoside phosphotransferase family enzyme
MMHTYQIADHLLDEYKNEKLSNERIDFLKAQADEQLAELAQNQELYDKLLQKVKAPEKIDNIILWMLLMSDEDICLKYRREFQKEFRMMIPVSDLADLMLYVVHLKKIQNVELEGMDYLLEYKHDGKDEFDQYSFTNVLLYVQKQKESDCGLQF